MKKLHSLVLLAALTATFTCSANTSINATTTKPLAEVNATATTSLDAFQTEDQVIHEWVILSACMKYSKLAKGTVNKTDTVGGIMLRCVNDAKRKPFDQAIKELNVKAKAVMKK